MRAVVISFALGLGLGLTMTAAGSDFHPIRAAETAVTKHAPGDKARVHLLAPDAASAFVGLLEINPGAGVPEHQDESEEFVYVIEGGGQITVDGIEHGIKPGDLVYMPAGATVSFKATDDAPTKVLQIFAPTTSAKKYDRWSPAE